MEDDGIDRLAELREVNVQYRRDYRRFRKDDLIKLRKAVRSAAGVAAHNQRSFIEQIEPFFAIFLGGTISPARLESQLKYISTPGKNPGPTQAFLAWLCFYHEPAARSFYASVGLDFFQFDGDPRDALRKPHDKTGAAINLSPSVQTLLIDGQSAILDGITTLTERQDQMIYAIQELFERQKNEALPASVELVSAIGEGGRNAVNPDNFATYLEEMLNAWREGQARTAAIMGDDSVDRVLLQQAQAATDRGDFITADYLFAEVERRHDVTAAHQQLAAKASIVASRATNADLAGHHTAAVDFYDTASILIRNANPAQSLSYACRAANVLYLRAFKGLDSSILRAAATRYSELASLAESLPGDHTKIRISATISSCDALMTLSYRGLSGDHLGEAERLCRDAITSEVDGGHPHLFSRLRSSLASIISQRYGDRDIGYIEESVYHYNRSLLLSSYTDDPVGWRTTKSLLAISMSQKGRHEAGTRSLRKAARIHEELAALAQRDEDSEQLGRAKFNLAGCLLSIGEKLGQKHWAVLALEYFEGALTYRDDARYPVLYATTIHAIGRTRFVLASKFGELGHLDRAVEFFSLAADLLFQKQMPSHWLTYKIAQLEALNFKAAELEEQETAHEAYLLASALFDADHLICSHCAEDRILKYVFAAITDSQIFYSLEPVGSASARLKRLAADQATNSQVMAVIITGLFHLYIYTAIYERSDNSLRSFQLFLSKRHSQIDHKFYGAIDRQIEHIIEIASSNADGWQHLFDDPDRLRMEPSNKEKNGVQIKVNFSHPRVTY